MTKQNLIKRFFARFMRARAASAAPAFFFAAAAAGFALAPLDASAARISADVETGSFGDASDQSLAVGSGNITIGGDASVNVTETTLLTGTQLTISSISDTLNFGNVTFQQPVASDSITVSGENVSVAFDKVAAGTGYGKIDVAEGAALVINGDANLSAITAENGTLTVKGKATVETLTAKTGATVTLEADDASGVNSLVMAGGTVNVNNFTLDNVDGTNEDNNNASGTISSSGTLTVNTGTTLTTEELNLTAKENGVIDLKNGSKIDLGSGAVSLGANAQLNIGDADGTANLTAASLTAADTATTTLNGGTLTLNGAGITQKLDSLAESSTGTVSVSGEGATAVFSENKTFEGDAASGEVLDIAVANGTLQVDAAVSTKGTVYAKNLTIGEAGTSVKASAFELSPEGTLTMNGGTLDLSATNDATTDIYKIADGSSGTITEGDTAGMIALNKTSTDLGELNFTAESGTVSLKGTAEDPISVETAGDVNARNLVVGANKLVGDNVTVGKATERTGDGLTLNGGTLTGTTNVTVNKVVEENLSGTVDGGTVIFDLDQEDIEGETVVAGTLNLGSEATNTNKVWIRGEGLTLGEGSDVTATGDGVNADNGAATGLVVGGGAAGTATVFDLSETGTKLNVNAVNVYSDDELKLSGDQKIGIGETAGKIYLGVAANVDEDDGKITTTGTLTSLGQTTMNGGRIESFASSPAPAPEQPEEGKFYPEATIHLGNVAMGNGVISAVNGSVKVAAVSDQGIIAAKDISVGSVSDDDTDKVVLAGSEDGATAADKLTFTGTAASNISANAASVVNTAALELADGTDVTIGSSTNADILNEENLASVALGGGASLDTTSDDLSALTSVALATGTADDRTTWTHSSGITVAGDVSVGNRSDITAESINFGGANLKIGGTATLNSTIGNVTLGGVKGLEKDVLATATVESAANIVFAANSESSLHLKATTGDIVVNENVFVTLSQGEINAVNTTLKDGSTFELLGNNNVLGGTTGTPEENPYELSEVTLGGGATLVIGGNNPADESEFYETFAKADSVKNASASAVGTIEVNGKLAADETTEDKVSVFTAETVGDATTGGVNVTLNEGGELVATGEDAGVGIYAAALNGTGGKLTAQAADGTKNHIYVTASNTVGENIVFTADELRVTDLDVSDGADVAVRLENADLDGVNRLVVADAAAAGTDETTTLTLAGTPSVAAETSSVAAVTVGKDGNNGTLIVESLPAEGEEPAAPVVVIGDLAADETANFQTGSLTLDGGALVATDGRIDVRNALVAGTNGLDGTLEAANVCVDLSAQMETFGANLTLKGETVTLDGNVGSGFTLGSVVEAGKLVIGSDAESETTAVIVADPATTLDGVADEIVVENGDSLFVTSDWTPEQDSLTVTLDTGATLAVSGLSDFATLTVGAGKSFAVNAAVDEEGNVAEPNGAVFDEIVNNGNFSLENVDANTSSWTDAEGATLTITGTKTDTEERLASLDISGAAGGTTTFNSTVSLTNGALAVAQGDVVLNGAVVSENGTVDVEAGDLTANDTVSLTDSEVTASGNVVLNDAVSSANGAITATTGSLTVSGGAGTIESLALTAGADITFDTKDFLTDGAVTVVAAQGTGDVTFDTNVSLGAGSSVAADTLTVNAGAEGTINGTVDVKAIVLSGATSAPDPVKDAASLTISGEGNSTFTTLTDAAGTTLSLTNGAALTQNGDATASVSLNGTLSVADPNSAFSTPGSLTLADTAKLTLANGGAANIAGTLDLSTSTTDAVTVDGDGTDSDATTTLTAGTLVINPSDAADNTTQGVVLLTNGGQFTVGELAAGSTVTLTGQDGSGNIWVDETSHFTLKKGDIAITESTRGEIVAESGNVTFGHDAGGNGVYSLAGIGTQGLDLSVNSGHDEVNFTMSESLNADGETYTYSKVDVRGMMNLQGIDVSATSTKDQAFKVSVASGVNLDNANLTLKNVAFSGGKSVSLTGSSELSATNTTIGGFDAIITTVGANNSSITLNKATLKTDVTMNSGTLNVGSEGATIDAGHTVSVNENVSAKLEGSLTGEGKLALNGGNVSLTGDEVTLGNVVVNAANAKISGGETLTIDNLEIGTGDALTVDAALSASGDWNIDGGSLTAGTLTIETGASVSLTNSTVAGDITFADGADAELSLTESTVDGNVTLDGDNNTLYVTDSAITGALTAEKGEIHFDGENSFGGLDLTGDVGVFGMIAVKGKLEVDGGFNLAGSSSLSTTEGLFVNGGTANLAGEVVAGDVTLTGTIEGSTLSGTIKTNLTLDNAQLSSSGEVVGSTTLGTGSTLTQTAGTLGAVSVDASTFTQNAGTAGAVTLTNDAFATLAGTVASLDATNATANVSGTVSGDMTLTNALISSSGEVVGSTTLANGSTLTQTAGSLDAVSVDASTFTQESAGTAGAVTLTNGASATLAGTVASLDATNASANVSGTVSGAVSLDASTLTAVDGITISDTLTAENNSIVNGDIMLDGDADVSLSGSTVNGDIAFAESANGADLKLIESTVAGNVTLSGESNSLRVENSSITGALTATAGTITFDGTNSFGDLQLSGDVNVAGDITVDGALNAEGGFNLAGSSKLSTTEGLFVNGGTATLAGTVTQGDVTLTGTIEGSTLSGTIETNLTLDNAQLSSSGTVEGRTTLANGSTLTQTDGTLHAVSVDASTFTQEAGTAGAVTLTNGASATLAGTVASLDATNATAEVSGTVSGDMTLTNAAAEVSGTVNGSTTLTNGSTLTQTDGTLGAVSADASTFTQNAGTAGAVTLTNGASATLAGTVASLDATNATANVSGTVSGAVSLDASTLTAEGGKTFSSLALKNNSTLVSTDDITVTGAITDASGSISGANVALNGGLTGSASVTASGDLTLGGTTETSGSLTAGTLTVAAGGTLTATDAQVEAGTLAVNEGATLNLTIEDDALDVGTLSIDGTANLTAANALTLSNLSGAGTANKDGAGALTLSGNGAFTGVLNIGAGNASLSGAFGGSIGFASEGGTITGAHGASVAGTLTLAQGTTLEIGDASGAANLTVGKLALSAATARTAGTAKVVHDVFTDGTDTLTITDATANLSGLTAVVRSNIDEELLGVGGQTITLVEGDVAAGYGFIEGIGFDRTNAVLSEDGKSLQVMLNWKAAADGLAGSLFNDNQRAVAAATKSWDASTNKYAQALSTLSTTETAAALDDLGALHTVAMMPGQIDGTWNHQKSVLNAIGTGSQMGYQFGKPDVNMGAWVQYVGSYNDVDSSSDRLGWDRTMNGATAGFEYAVSENFLAGVALGYEYAELKSDGNKIEDDAFSVDFFAKHRSGDFEQRAALTFAHHGYDTNRTIAFGGVAESVSGDTDGFTAAIAYEAAYNFAVKEYLTLAPVATLRAALNTIDGWSESGSDAALKFDDQSAFTALAGIGGRAEFTFANPSYPREALRLSAYALFTAEFGDRSSDVDASFVRGGNAFTMTYDDPEPYALQLGLTAFAPLTNRTALFGGISTELRDEESGFNANIGVRIGW